MRWKVGIHLVERVLTLATFQLQQFRPCKSAAFPISILARRPYIKYTRVLIAQAVHIYADYGPSIPKIRGDRLGEIMADEEKPEAQLEQLEPPSGRKKNRRRNVFSSRLPP